ncbi:DUF1800 domain-containing protein [Fuscibacter oryzae]|uniref:DUF1800 domain-containing protein n=1 Tax=Fuscibacter oryzae TaxID=2803939 RepID=A0A8J7MRF5_9RHOB|nr:DUF1800 domain-containing protein [Fuscibacter oryzae]MBL4928543.1 DUF1800 domain-containing protein [Fuscibacter oryzae]
MTPAEIAAFRFGYGPGPGMAITADALLAGLAKPDSAALAYPIVAGDDLTQMLSAADQARLAAKRHNPRDPALDARAIELDQAVIAASGAALRATLARAVAAPDGLRERLGAFWADHFTVAAPGLHRAIMPAAMAEEAIRPHLTGNFADMLTAVALHPAMLIYLDQSFSTGPNSALGKRKGKGLNENFARELLELHTLGVGAGYAQDDVRELAKLLSGLSWRLRTGFSFNPQKTEPGPQVVLGKTYAGDTLDTVREVLGDLARRPETATHLARKLAVHFVADAPDAGLVAALEGAFLQGGGALMPVYEVLLRHPAALVPEMAKARQPWDFLVASLRALGVTGDDIMAWPGKHLTRRIIKPLIAMGQPWKQPRGPDGWAEDFAAWISPSGLATRITWAMSVPETILRPLPDPAAVARGAFGTNPPDTVIWAASRAETRADGIGLVLASPAFNRR